jgi:hypothetical protein
VKRGRFGFAGLILGLALFSAAAGCGSSGGGGDPAATQTSCTAYCTAYFAAACPTPMYTSMADCMSSECAQAAGFPAGCQSALKTYYDCRKTQADICGDTGCSSQFTATTTCH